MITEERLKKMKPGEIFMTGTTSDDENGINIWTTGGPIQWIAKRGDGFYDWAVYTRGHWNAGSVPNDNLHISLMGDKCPERFLKNIIPCDEGALKLYRR